MTGRPKREPEPEPPAGRLSGGAVTGSHFDGTTFLVGSGNQFISMGSPSAEFPRPGTWPTVQDATALGLGVHRARPRGDSDEETVPPYVARDFDNELRARLRRSAVDGGMVLLTGDSTSGKSRAAFEAVKSEMPEHQVFSPPHGADLRRLPDLLTSRPGRYLLWLDDLEGHLGRDGLQPDLLSALLRLRLAVVATLRDGFRDMLWPQAERNAAASGDVEAQRQSHSGSHVLDLAELVEVPRVWSATELERASWEEDPRLVDALKYHGKYGISEYLAAGPELWQEWRQAMRARGHPRGAALVAAAVDLARTGLKEPFTVQLIEEAHEHYLVAGGGRALRPEPLSEAWEWAQTIRYGVTSLLIPGPGESEWQAFDYLTDSAFRDTRLRVPEATWRTAIARSRDDDEKFEVGWQAMARDAPRQLAAVAFEPLALAGDAVAANNMGSLSELRILEQLKGNMFSHLARALSGRVDMDKALDYVASTSLDQIAAEPMSALRAFGLLDIANSPEAADAERWYRLAYEGGHQEAAKNLASLLRQLGREAEAIGWYEKAAEVGIPGAAGDLGQLHEQLGHPGEADLWYRRAAQAGDRRAAGWLRQLLQRQGGADDLGAPVPRPPAYDPKSDGLFDRRVAGTMNAAVEVIRKFQEDIKARDRQAAPERVRELAGSDSRRGRRAEAASGLPPAGPEYGRPAWERAGRRVLYGHSGRASVVCVAEVSPGRALLASGGDDGTIRRWNPSTGEPDGEPATGHDQVSALCPVTLADGRAALASGDTAGQIRVWDAATGRLIRGPFMGHEGEVTALCAVGDSSSSLLASGDSDGLIQLWDLNSGWPRPVRLKSGTQPVLGLCGLTDADGKAQIASASGSPQNGDQGGKIQLWAADDDQPVGEPFGTLGGGITAVSTVRGADGSVLIAAGHADGITRLWNPANGEQAGPPLAGSIGPVSALCPVPLPGRSAFLACGGENGALQFWSLTTGLMVGEIIPEGHSRPVASLCAVPVGDQRTAIAAAGGSWAPHGGQPSVEVYYPKAAAPGPSGDRRRLAPGAIRAAVRRHARNLPAEAPAERPRIAVETENAAAIAAFESAVERVDQGRTDGAEQLYRQGLTAGHCPSVNGLAMTLEGQGQLDEAERLYRKAARNFLCQAELNLGDLLMKRAARAEAWAGTEDSRQYSH
jgi:TPR repeat protein